MGKFGNRVLPKFMEPQLNKPKKIQETQLEGDIQLDQPNNKLQILSTGESGDDYIMITIKTEEGEEMELKFSYDGKGQLTSQHGDNEYTIPVEVELSDEDMDDLENDPLYNDTEEIEDTEADFNEPGISSNNTFGKASNFKDFMKSNHIDEDCLTGDCSEEAEPAEYQNNELLSDPIKLKIKGFCKTVLIPELMEITSEPGTSDNIIENYLTACSAYIAECLTDELPNTDTNQ